MDQINHSLVLGIISGAITFLVPGLVLGVILLMYRPRPVPLRFSAIVRCVFIAIAIITQCVIFIFNPITNHMIGNGILIGAMLFMFTVAATFARELQN